MIGMQVRGEHPRHRVTFHDLGERVFPYIPRSLTENACVDDSPAAAIPEQP